MVDNAAVQTPSEAKASPMAEQQVPCNVKDAAAMDNATTSDLDDTAPSKLNGNDCSTSSAVAGVSSSNHDSLTPTTTEAPSTVCHSSVEQVVAAPKDDEENKDTTEVGDLATSNASETTKAPVLSVATAEVEKEKNEVINQDNEVLSTPVSSVKGKLKPLSPTAEPFVMSSNVFTPKKGVSSPVAIDTVDVSGGGLGTPSFVTGNLPPVTPVRGGGPMRSPRGHGSPRSNLPVSPNVELSAKQVRELRRLCRKTANRAEYEGRLVQLRQIASILAMGGPSLVHFAPSYLSAHSSMQAWLDMCRTDGADWRDERPLSVAAVEELREWDRLLKAWAKRRFPTLADCTEGSAPPTTPRSKRADIMTIASPMSVTTPSPARQLVSQQITSPAAGSGPGSARGNRRVSRISIETCGDSMNVSIIRTPDRNNNSGGGGKSPWRTAGSPRRDQENISPDGGDSTARDWAALRKSPGATNVGAAADKNTNPVTPLKARNW